MSHEPLGADAHGFRARPLHEIGAVNPREAMVRVLRGRGYEHRRLGAHAAEEWLVPRQGRGVAAAAGLIEYDGSPGRKDGMS